MKKNKILLYIFVGFLAVVCMASFCFIPNLTLAQNEQESNAPIAITSIDDFANINLSGNYYLANDIYGNLTSIDNTKLAIVSGKFTGTLNGNGHTIAITQNLPIFEQLLNANIYNLSFGTVTIKDNDGKVTEEHNHNYILCNNNTVAEQNIGIIAGKISNSSLSQIKVLNTNITYIEQIVIKGTEGNPDQIQTLEHSLTNNTNLGVLVGLANNGSKITNCFVQNVTLNIKIDDTNANNFNFGGIVGRVENSNISNNIINLRSVKDNALTTSVNIISDYQKTINVGGIVGLLDYDKNYLYNNVMLIENKNVNVSKVLISNFGTLIGNMAYELYESNINGFLTIMQDSLFGTRVSTTQNYKNISYTTYENLNSSIFTSSNWYNLDEYKWNFNTTWMNVANSKLPVLQTFESFNLLFDTEESLKTLNIETLPKGQVLNAVVYEQSPETPITVVSYGKTVYINVELIAENNYDKFFYISALELNGKTVYDNVTKTVAEGFENISLQENEPPQEPQPQTEPQNLVCTYKIENFNANNSGIYSIVLGRQAFKLKVKVHDLGNEEQGSILPGKFKTNTDTNPITEKNINLIYGEKYIISTSVTNTDYSDKAYWYIYKNDKEVLPGEDNAFVPSEADENFYANKIEFVFNEDCSLFVKDEEKLFQTIFDINTYQETEIEGVLQPNFELNIVYVKRVKLVKIVLAFDDEQTIKTQIAKILINNKNDRLVWNEAEGVFYAKLAFDFDAQIDYIIKLDEMEAGYQFDDWYYSINMGEKLKNIEDDDRAGEFAVTSDLSDDEPLTIYCVFKANAKNDAGNLLWLWITLGGVGLALVIVVIVIIVKKKRGGGSSYKKYYY